MAVDSYGTQNQPHFDESKPGNQAPDLTAVADYAAKVGNRKWGTASQRAALTGADVWAGLEYFETDTKWTWYHNGSAWILFNVPPTSFSPTFSGCTVGNSSVQAMWAVTNGIATISIHLFAGSGFSLTAGTAVDLQVINLPVTLQNYLSHGAGTYYFNALNRAGALIAQVQDSGTAILLRVVTQPSATATKDDVMRLNLPMGNLAANSGASDRIHFTVTGFTA